MFYEKRGMDEALDALIGDIVLDGELSRISKRDRDGEESRGVVAGLRSIGDRRTRALPRRPRLTGDELRTRKEGASGGLVGMTSDSNQVRGHRAARSAAGEWLPSRAWLEHGGDMSQQRTNWR